MSENLAVTPAHQPLASERLSTFLGIPRDVMIDTIKKQCFRNAKEEITDAQLAAFISIANDMQVNPLLPGMLYAYPDRGAIFPIMGPDGVFKKLAERDDIESWETVVYPEDVSLPPTHAITKIYRKGRERPLAYTALLSEWKVASNPNWMTRPRHMLGLRSLKQCARQIIHGIPGDEDDRVMAEINVTPPAEEVKRTAPPQREKKGAAAVKENADKAIEAQATVVEEKAPAAEPAKAPAAEAKTAPAAEAKAPEKRAAGRTELKEDEHFTATCTVQSFVTKTIKVKGVDTPSVKAEIKGDFTGTVVHLGGATIENGALKENPAWQIEKPVVVKLFGKKASDGRIAPVVEGIALEGQPATQDGESFA